MKKIIFLVGALYIVFLISFKEPKEKPTSFSEMIKNDPSRIKELLEVADLLNSSSRLMQKGKGNRDKIDKSKRDEIRHSNSIKITPKDSPTIKISIDDMQEIVDTFKTSGSDTLVFYLGSYKDPGSIKNYNTRNKTNFPKKEFDNKITFIIGAKGGNMLLPGKEFYFDAVTMCPPPSDGSCN
jgi:hypothetical protein